MDVYHPFGPIRAAGQKHISARLENVPGSVDMTEYSYYEGIKNRWVDIWELISDKGSARIQSIRCYSPADLFLLIEGTGFTVQKILFKGQEIDFENSELENENAFEDHERNFVYTAILKGGLKKIQIPGVKTLVHVRKNFQAIEVGLLSNERLKKIDEIFERAPVIS